MQSTTCMNFVIYVFYLKIVINPIILSKSMLMCMNLKQWIPLSQKSGCGWMMAVHSSMSSCCWGSLHFVGFEPRVEGSKRLGKNQEEERGHVCDDIWDYTHRIYWVFGCWTIQSLFCNRRMGRYMFHGTAQIIYSAFLLCKRGSKSCREGWTWGDMKLFSGFGAWQKSRFPEALKSYWYLSLKVKVYSCWKNLRTKFQGIK